MPDLYSKSLTVISGGGNLLLEMIKTKRKSCRPGDCNVQSWLGTVSWVCAEQPCLNSKNWKQPNSPSLEEISYGNFMCRIPCNRKKINELVMCITMGIYLFKFYFPIAVDI